MTWMISGTPVTDDRFAKIAPIEVLYELETPKIFTARLGQDLVLVYESCLDVSERSVRFLVTSTSEATIAALKEGTKTVLQALQQPCVWLVKENFDGTSGGVYQLTAGMHSVPEGYKPQPSAMLWPELMPMEPV